MEQLHTALLNVSNKIHFPSECVETSALLISVVIVSFSSDLFFHFTYLPVLSMFEIETINGNSCLWRLKTHCFLGELY